MTVFSPVLDNVAFYLQFVVHISLTYVATYHLFVMIITIEIPKKALCKSGNDEEPTGVHAGGTI